MIKSLDDDWLRVLLDGKLFAYDKITLEELEVKILNKNTGKNTKYPTKVWTIVL